MFRECIRWGICRMKKYGKKIKASFYVALYLILCFLGIRMLQNQLNCKRMLQTVGLDESYGLKQVDYSYWHDPLKYGDGYEIMVFASDDKSWMPPESWIEESDHVSVDAIAGEIGIGLNTNAILDLSLGGERCRAWFFADHRSDRPFNEQDFYFAYCDETYSNRVVVFIYRGHHLYGM